jgi:23S rRNA pseudouridine1911/1915/1917 synthase
MIRLLVAVTSGFSGNVLCEAGSFGPQREPRGALKKCMEKLFDIVYEDDELLVINKPADLVCHPTKGDVYSSLISRVRLHLRQSDEAHLINRLDRETSGLVLVAKNLPVARQLRELWERRLVQKQYLAIVRGHVLEGRSLIDAPLGRDEESQVAIKDKVRADGAVAQTEFALERRFSRAEGDFSLLRVWPLTGRKHQIRIHLAHVGHPIVGDKLYGGDENLYLDFVQCRLSESQRRELLLPNQALHAAELRFDWRGQEAVFHAAPETWFTEFVDQNFIILAP